MGFTRLMPHLTSEDDQSLQLHRAVAARLVADPSGVLASAAENLAALRADADPAASARLDRWAAVLTAGPEAVLDALISRDPSAGDLRRTSPFTAVLPDAERRALATLADTSA